MDCKDVHNSNYTQRSLEMKKRKLRPWIQDMLIVSVIGKLGFMLMLADIVVSPVTFMILAYVVISLMLEVHLLSKYELRTSLFIKVEE